MKKTFVEYVWIDNVNKYRSKTRVLDRMVSDVGHVPLWNFDGSSTGQIYNNTINNTEVFLKPVCLFNDPFRKKNHKIVLCECYDELDVPNSSNTRHCALENAFRYKKNLKPWFGLEQEYFILNEQIKNKLACGEIEQGQYYCSVGGNNAFLRKIVDRHLEACIEAGLNISGINAEVAPYQWEFQIGPCTGIDAGDQLWVARYLLERIAEEDGYYIDWSPKPFEGINGSGCHTNFSTIGMRNQNNGLELMLKSIKNLENTHSEDVKFFGKGNDSRMSGQYETSSYDKFSFDINTPVNRGASVRIGYDSLKNGYGYFEDRRPGSNIDPYQVTKIVFSSAL